MDPGIKLSVILVNYKTDTLLADCLRSLHAHLRISPRELIVVDNASPDLDAPRLSEAVPDLRIVRLATNRGFAAGNNEGARHSRGEYLWLLNTDTIVPPDNRMELVLDFLDQHPQYAAALPLLTDAGGKIEPGQIQYFASIPRMIAEKPARLLARIFRLRTSAALGRVHPDFLRIEARDVQHATAAALVVRRSAFNAVGGFDERYFMYFEDMDLCRKLHAAGYRIRFIPEARIIHLLGKSLHRTRARRALHVAGQDTYFRKWHGGPAAKVLRFLRLPLAAWYRLRDR